MSVTQYQITVSLLELHLSYSFRENKCQIRSLTPDSNRSLTIDDVRSEINEHVSKLKAVYLCKSLEKTCLPGPPGRKGSRGPRGRRGLQGPKGKRGEQGIMGSPGRHGKQGITGDPGMQGEKGEKGASGSLGITGQKGEPGETASSPEVTISPDTQTVTENQTASFYCSASGYPRPTVTWSKVKGSLTAGCVITNGSGRLQITKSKFNDSGEYTCSAVTVLGRDTTTAKLFVEVSCDEFASKEPIHSTGIYALKIQSAKFEVFCHIHNFRGWNLIARFSNSDTKSWMRDDGSWWYDPQIEIGTITNPSENADMISPAFWLVRGREFKITRSDDLSHTPLLQTTGSCLAGQTFRSKITSYGNFRNGKVWASNQCLGSCTVQYGGQYKSTDGFQQAKCSGNIQSANKIGFWCDWDKGDGSVMMIGGGGSSCSLADHGIGITESNAASFVLDDLTEYDFGYDGNPGSAPTQAYSLNLWIR